MKSKIRIPKSKIAAVTMSGRRPGEDLLGRELQAQWAIPPLPAGGSR